MLDGGQAILVESREDGSDFEVHFHEISPAKVTLFSWPRTIEGDGPERLLAYGMRSYLDEWDWDNMTPEEIDRFSKDAVLSGLPTPLEWPLFVFLVEGVSRSWTHQAVRYRIGSSFNQQSMRMFGQGNKYHVLATKENQKYKDLYYPGMVAAINCYDKMVLAGSPLQDARGVLPHHILTCLIWGITLKSLMHVYNTRHCCQAQQDEWAPVLRQMKKEIRTKVGDPIANMITGRIDRGESCGFNASIDRACRWRRADGTPLPEEEQI